MQAHAGRGHTRGVGRAAVYVESGLVILADDYCIIAWAEDNDVSVVGPPGCHSQHQCRDYLLNAHRPPQPRRRPISVLGARSWRAG